MRTTMSTWRILSWTMQISRILINSYKLTQLFFSPKFMCWILFSKFTFQLPSLYFNKAHLPLISFAFHIVESKMIRLLTFWIISRFKPICYFYLLKLISRPYGLDEGFWLKISWKHDRQFCEGWSQSCTADLIFVVLNEL